jgi:polysaccharide biosynthesis protein PslG
LSLRVARALILICCLGALTGTEAQQGTSKLSPFGIGSDDLHSRDLRPWLLQMTKTGVRNLRACRTLWESVEPQEGIWNWQTMDAQLDFTEANHIECWGFLYGEAPWNKKDRPGGFPSHNLEAWSQYVTETVKHAHGRIKYWEVWNEPPNGTNDAPPADYGKLMAVTYAAVKAVDPTAKVGLAAQSVNLNYLEQAIQAGAKDHFDYITLHPYETMGTVISDPGCEAIFLNIVRATHKMLAAQDPARAHAPVWITEIGFDAGKSARLQAEALVKAYTLSIAQGIEVVNWFEGIDGDSGPMGLLEANGTPRPAYHALAQMIRYLGPHPIYQGWVSLAPDSYGFVFQGREKTVMVAWAMRKAAEVPVSLGITIKPVEDAETESALTNSPVLVLGISPAQLRRAKLNRTKPFPWGGDYTGANSVSVNLGEGGLAQGLHVLNGDAVAADVVAYGGGARSGAAPQGMMFAVDPNFLTYTALPIEITAQVRREPNASTAKLELVYESTHGYQKPAPYEIPDDGQWHTATWKIRDSQFVGKWAYNFRFLPGAYLVKTVKVTKLP